MTQSTLAQLVLALVPLSLLSLGGINVLIPELHRLTVDTLGLVSGREFADLYAIAQASPGPTILPVFFFGLRAEGVFGAFVTAAALLIPACAIALLVAATRDRWVDTRFGIALRRAIAPVAVGLFLASAYLLGVVADRTVGAVLLSVAAGILMYSHRFHPVVILAAGGAIGHLGLIA